MRHLKRHLTKSDDLDVHMAFAPQLPLKDSNGGTTPLQLPRAVATPARPCKARRSPDRTLVGRVSWSDIAQTSQESLTAPDASPCTPGPAFRIRTPKSPPSAQWRKAMPPGADLEMTDINEGRLRQEFCEVEEIGRGQFSTVYKAKNCVDQCHYAVKKTTRISKGLRQTELREVFALANVSMEAAACPYIVRYYSSWLEDGRLHIQTELCRCSLRDRLNERKAWPSCASFTENEVLEVLRHVAAGLHVLHSLGFVHLDIKPDNILVARSDEGCYKIADLGLAAAAMGTGCDDITEGDCRYLAKEVLRGDLRDLPKADVFSLGLVLYELAINPRGLPSNGPEWQMIRERLEVQILSQLSQNMQLLLQEMACANRELRPTCEALLQRVGNSTPEMKALEEENRRCREEAARNKQRADSYWQEIVQMKKQELLTTSTVPMRDDESNESKVQLRRSHTSH